jgi:membrane protease YdiL (CAAX protease family)
MQIFTSLLFLVSICFYYIKKFGGASFVFNKEDISFLLKSIGMCLLLYVLWMPVVNSYKIHFREGFSGFMSFSWNLSTVIKTVPQSISFYILIWLVSPIAEEIIFRGVFQTYLEQKFKFPLIPILLTAFLFALMHVDLENFLSIFLTGSLFCFIYYKYKNLTINILCHFTWNVLCYLFPETERSITAYAIVVYILSIILFVFLIKSILADKKPIIHQSVQYMGLPTKFPK